MGMRINRIVSFSCLLMAFLAKADVNTSALDSFLDSFARPVACLSGTESRFYMKDFCASLVIEEYGGDTNRFVESVQIYCTNMCSSGLCSKADRSRLKGALELLCEYGSPQSVDTFSFCASNSNDRVVCSIAAMYYVELAPSIDIPLAYFASAGVQSLPIQKLSAICDGMTDGFETIERDSVATNKMVRMGLDVIAERRYFWGPMDCLISKWWPAYATSSNRYMSAISARNTVPPPASTNYINRVITELEALPPGTMQMLSTNHLGAAWNEN